MLAGIAAHDGVIVCSLVRQNELLYVDARSKEIVRKMSVDNPRGVTFDSTRSLAGPERHSTVAIRVARRQPRKT